MSDKPYAGTYYWSVELEVECPSCMYQFDANSTDDFSEQLRGAFVCQPVKGCVVTCEHCDTTFEFDIGGGT